MLSPRQLTDARARALVRAWPDLLDPGIYHKVLYIGANARRFQLYRLLSTGREVHVLEAHPPNAAALRADPHHPVAGIVCGDVRKNFELCWHLAPFDLIVWWHGPEHVPKADLPRLLAPSGAEGLGWLCRGAILCGSPWGRYEQGAVGGNAYERHQSALYPSDYRAWGFDHTLTHGRPDVPGSHISAWRVIR